MITTADGSRARHEIENLLYTYAALADDCDADGIGELLARAELQFADQSPLVGAQAITAHFRALYSNGLRSRHLVSNLVVDSIASRGDQLEAEASARYARWLLDDSPRLVALGQYVVTVQSTNDSWRITRLQVIRAWQETT